MSLAKTRMPSADGIRKRAGEIRINGTFMADLADRSEQTFWGSAGAGAKTRARSRVPTGTPGRRGWTRSTFYLTVPPREGEA